MSDDDRDLDLLFDAARSADRAAPEALLARIEADAQAVQGGWVATALAPRRRFLGLIEAFGGWPGLAGLSTAAVMGVWVGAVDPLEMMPVDLIPGVFADLDVAEPAFGYSDLAWGLE